MASKTFSVERNGALPGVVFSIKKGTLTQFMLSLDELQSLAAELPDLVKEAKEQALTALKERRQRVNAEIAELEK